MMNGDDIDNKEHIDNTMEYKPLMAGEAVRESVSITSVLPKY